MSERVKCFWVTLSGNWAVRVKDPNGDRTCIVSEVEKDDITSGRSKLEWESASPMYRLPDGSEVRSQDLPPGAMWNAEYLTAFPEQTGPDGISLHVRLPNRHTWNIDSRASNCTRPDDKKHKCWCRHGDPRTGEIHVDKNGDTCAAGAGSIIAADYHGFLHNGHLVPC